MADLLVIEELQDYLIGQGVAQHPDDPPSLTTPSVWLLPRKGAPLPRAGENMTITLSDTMLAAPAGLEAWIEEAFVDVVVRARNPSAGKLVQRQIKGLLMPFDQNYARKQWAMAGIDPVEYSREWRGDQPLPQRQSVGETDPHVTYDRVASYVFGVRRKILAGLTLP